MGKKTTPNRRPEFCGVSKGLKYLVLLTPGFDDVVVRRSASTENVLFVFSELVLLSLCFVRGKAGV